MESTAGFWSYAREDDEQDDGRVRELAEAVKREYSLITGEELQLFVDRDIEWGEEWKRRIDDALAVTTFFIPVITPRYFQRDACRRELLTFAGHAKSLGREDLLMSIYYVSVPGLMDEEQTDDEAVSLVSSMQWDDWRELRLEAKDSSEYRRRVNKLARRLAAIKRADTDRDEPPIGSVVATSDDEEPGVLELVAEAEEAFPRFNGVLEELTREITAMGGKSDLWGPRVEKVSGRGAAALLFAFRGFAEDIDPHSKRVEELGRQYVAELVTIDPAILSLLRLAETGGWDEDDILTLIEGIHELHKTSTSSLESLRTMEATIDEISGLSKDLRKTLKQVQAGLRNIADAQAVIDEWERRAIQVEKKLRPDEKVS
jgi:hypothetical protein